MKNQILSSAEPVPIPVCEQERPQRIGLNYAQSLCVFRGSEFTPKGNDIAGLDKEWGEKWEGARSRGCAWIHAIR